VAYGRVGVSTQEFGGLCAWLVNVLNVATGNLDRVGGALFTRPAADLVAFADRIGQRGHFDKGRSRVRGLPEFSGEYPVAGLADEILAPGPGQVRALVTLAGNPVLSSPNGAALDRALASLDFMVSVDLYLNETTRHAHLVLPPTFALEHDNYDLALHVLAVRNTAKYSPALFAPARGAHHDWQILNELAYRVAVARGRGRIAAALTRAVLARLGPGGLTAGLLRFGPYGAGLRPFGRGLTWKRLRSSPHGIDLGPLEPSLPARLYTADKRIRLAPARFVADLARLAARLPEIEAEARDESADTGPLRLIGRRELRSNNSWMHNSARLVKGKERCTLLMHPGDAAARGLRSGQPVRIRSRVGSVEAPLETTDAMRRGVVSLPHGYGHGRDGVRLGVAREHAGVSLNDLTDHEFVDALSGNASFSGVPVVVTSTSA
jgi:anaerobic selenocysteine-containing dehydrogenase